MDKKIPDVATAIFDLSGKDLADRKVWYSPAVAAYSLARPPYPAEVVQRVAEIAQLTGAEVLEIGCGPGTATVDFAPLVKSIDCLEPNSDFYHLAQSNCAAYSNLRFHNQAFEEWQNDQKFDAILAASSFHWIPAAIGYPKAASLLPENGALILLWNKELQPSWEVHQQFAPIYQRYAPQLDRYENRETEADVLRQLGQMAIDSGYFDNLVGGAVRVAVTYDVDRYLTLLNTYSPYLQLDPVSKEALFNGLGEIIKNDLGGKIDLQHTSAFHVTHRQKLGRGKNS
jgi:protein-L-isoaspartate O-methyltransferase